jgi:hypothetical protein
VIRPAARAAALLLVAPFLTFVSALTAQHVHEPEPGHDHEEAVVHSHFSPHHTEEHDHLGLADESEIDHGDGHVVWLDGSTLHETPYQAHPAPPAIPAGFETVHIERHWSVTPFDDAAPVHGPPRPASPFRGPPPSAV